ncbi:MAG TPA: DUF1775 domain-containing protein [Candidatus Binataceae bacterium]|nr:DUF1775 domain-containing protein [Candidatus Binataceae bacterium]
MISTRGFLQCLLAVLITAPVFGHVTVRPRESVAGTSEKYTMRVPTERSSPTVRIEVEFPDSVETSGFDPKPGWTIEYSKNASGKITHAVVSGSTIAPRESAEFTFNAKNPPGESTLVWKVIQIYQDGTRSEWTGPSGSRSPAPVTSIRLPSAQK